MEATEPNGSGAAAPDNHQTKADPALEATEPNGSEGAAPDDQPTV